MTSRRGRGMEVVVTWKEMGSTLFDGGGVGPEEPEDFVNSATMEDI